MKRTWTLVGVADVLASCKWYQSLFGQPETAPAHDYFGQNRGYGRNRFALPPQVGRARTSDLDESGEGLTWQWAPLVFPRR